MIQVPSLAHPRTIRLKLRMYPTTNKNASQIN